MEAVYQHANESRINFKVPKRQPLHQVWNSLWEQCEEANERTSSQKACFPRGNRNLPNIMKMLTVFQSEVQARGLNSANKTSVNDLCVDCGLSRSKQKLLEENYKRRGEMIEYLLSQTTTPFATNEGLKNQMYQSYLHNEDVGVERPNGMNKGSPVMASPQRPEVTENPVIHPFSLATKGANNLAFQPLACKDDREGEMTEYLLSQTTTPFVGNEGLKNQTYQSYPYNEDVGVAQTNGLKECTNKGTPVMDSTQRLEVAKIPLKQTSHLSTKGSNNLASPSLAYKDDIEEEMPAASKIHGMAQSNSRNLGQPNRYSFDQETPSKENTTRTLLDFLKHFTKYDPSKDPFTNMSTFENECFQYNLGPRESCLMMKLWLPSQMSARLSAPVASPAGGLPYWSNDYHWGDALDRVKALTHLVTGEDNVGIDILENLNAAPQDDPWEFARKFEQAYRLVIDVQDPRPPPALLKALVNKFSFVDRMTRMAASKEKTIEDIVRLVDSYQRENGLKAAPLWRNEVKPLREALTKESIPKDDQPLRWRRQAHNHQFSVSASHENIEGIHIVRANNDEDSCMTDVSLQKATMQSLKM